MTAVSANFQALQSPTLTPVARRILATELYERSLESGERLSQAEAALHLGSVRYSVCMPQVVFNGLLQAIDTFNSNGLGEKAALAKLMAARALCDMGRRADAMNAARLAIDDINLPAHYRAHAYSILGLCQMNTVDDRRGMATLMNLAMTDAISSNDAQALAHVYWACGSAQLIEAIRLDWRRLTDAEISDADTATAVIDMRSIVSRFDTAKSFEGASGSMSCVGSYTDLTRFLAIVLSNGSTEAVQHAVSGLSSIVSGEIDNDPPLSGWAMLGIGYLRLRENRVVDALETLDAALEIATRLGLVNLQREVLQLQGDAFERNGDIESALAVYKNRLPLQLISDTMDPYLEVSFRSAEAAHQGNIRKTALRAEHWAVKRAVDYVAANIGARLPIDQIVSHSGVGRRTLEIALKADMQCTIGELVRNSRLRYVATQLLQTDAAIGVVAGRAGYESSGALSRDFRQLFGTPPSVWRRTARAAARQRI